MRQHLAARNLVERELIAGALQDPWRRIGLYLAPLELIARQLLFLLAVGEQSHA